LVVEVSDVDIVSFSSSSSSENSFCNLGSLGADLLRVSRFSFVLASGVEKLRASTNFSSSAVGGMVGEGEEVRGTYDEMVTLRWELTDWGVMLLGLG